MRVDHAGNKLNDAAKINFKGNKSTLKGWIGGSDRNDFYKVRLNRKSSLELSLSKLSDKANIELLSQRGKILDRGGIGSKTQKTVNQELRQGTYYVRVFRQRGNTSYQLNLATSAASSSRKVQALQRRSFVSQVLRLTNKVRREAGLEPLTLNSKLTKVAQGYSQKMAKQDFFSHTAPNGDSVSDRIRAGGYEYSRVSENIAAGYLTPESVMDGWMNSRGHRNNILNPEVTEIGIGYYFRSQDPGEFTYQSYWTQNFGKPMQ